MEAGDRSGGFLGYLTLFSSLGTLLCCALPSLLVVLGLGATVASVVSSAPWLIGLSRHKNWVFAVAGTLIALNFLYEFRIAPRLRSSLRSSPAACPLDRPSACRSAGRFSRVVLWISGGLYLAGFFAAYLLGPILRWFSESS